MTKKERSKHDRLCDLVAERLSGNERYKTVDTYVNYSRRGLVGELDVIAITWEGVQHVYEIKTSHNNRNYRRANTQFKRYCRAFPKKTIKGTYVTPSRVKRLFNEEI